MSSKGASNRYTTTRGGRNNTSSPHINYAWAKSFNKQLLNSHFKKHGNQMCCNSKESYNAKSVKFANTIDKKNCISYVRKNGTTVKFNKETGVFSTISKKGIVSTYFKPRTGIIYYTNDRRNHT